MTHWLDLAQGLFLPPASHSGAGFVQAAGATSFTLLESKAQAALTEILIYFIARLCSPQQYCGSVQGCWSANRKDMGWMKVQDSGVEKRKLKCLWGWGRGQEACAKWVAYSLANRFWLILSLFQSWGALGTIPDVIVGLKGHRKTDSNGRDGETILHVCGTWATFCLYPSPWVTILTAVHFLFFRPVTFLCAEFLDNLL